MFYLSLFYTRYEFGQRLAMFYSQYAVAGAFGGLFSYFVFSFFPEGSSPRALPFLLRLADSKHRLSQNPNTPA